MMFLTLLASFLVLEFLKTVGWRPFRTIFCLFSTILEKSGPQIPNSFRKSQPHTASQDKVLCRKLSYTDPLIMRFSKKCVTEGRKPMLFFSIFQYLSKELGSCF